MRHYPPTPVLCAICKRCVVGADITDSPAGVVHMGACPKVCHIAGCDADVRYGEICEMHRARKRRGQDFEADSRISLREHHLEDVEWMVETGELFDRAAERLNVKPKTLEAFLRRAGRPDLYAALRAREVVA